MKTFRRESTNLYILSLLLIMPLMVGFKYTDIIFVKQRFFLIMFVIYLVCVFIALLWKLSNDRSMGGIEPPNIKEMIKTLSPLDWSMAAFAAIVLISSLTSRYTLKNTFMANESQLVGGYVFLAIVASFFLISRYAEASRMSYVAAFYISSLIILVLGLLNHARIDPLGMHKENVQDTFIYMASTIGNVDYYFSYMSIILIFFAAYRADMEWDWKAALVDLLSVISYMNLFTARASGCYVGVLFGLFALIFMGLTSFDRFRNLFWQGILSGIAGLSAEIFYHYKPDIYYGLEPYTSGLIMTKRLWLPFSIICLIVWILLGKQKRDDKAADISDKLTVLAKPVLIISVAAMAILEALILFYQRMQDFTGRTFIWNDLKTAYSMITFREKILGVGPGCMDLILIDLGIHTSDQPAFLTAHNEVFEFWFITGIVGAIAYLAIVITFIKSYFSGLYLRTKALNEKENRYFRELCCCGALFIAYLGQGLTNGPFISTIVVGYVFLSLYRRYQIPDDEA